MRAAVLLPVKAFAEAKVRLAGALAAPDRAAFARLMAERVLAAAAPLPVAVVCEDRGVADWAVALGAEVVWAPGSGLNGAVHRGVDHLAAAGIDQVIVAHADLPHAEALAALAVFAGVTLVPDRRDDGTNVIVVPAASGFVFAYGPGSFARHLAEARRLGQPVRIARLPSLQWDVDTPVDLEGVMLTVAGGTSPRLVP
jgi:2-phospho-L-lactate guanylyltransferase